MVFNIPVFCILDFLICDRISDRKQFKEEFILVSCLRREVADHDGPAVREQREKLVLTIFLFIQSGRGLDAQYDTSHLRASLPSVQSLF